VSSVITDATMTDFHWESFVVIPGFAFLGGSNSTTLTVRKPTAALVAKTTPISTLPDPPLEWNEGLSPPRGAWTLLFVPDTTVTATLTFDETAHFVYGYNGATGQTIGATTPFSVNLPPRRMVFLMLLGANHYYLHIL
jgi:hypothetical protein